MDPKQEHCSILNIKVQTWGLLLLLTCYSCTGQNKVNPGATFGTPVRRLGNSIFIVFQAHNGHYWFGSDGMGVYRYDGKLIVQYTAKDGLANERIREIQEDDHGNIYFTTFDGIIRFNGRDFTTLPADTSHKTDWKLQPGDMWFKGESGKNGPYRYDGHTLYALEFPKHYMADEFYKRFPNLTYSPYEVYHIYKDQQGTLWFGTSNFGICRFDGKKLSWMYEDHLTLIDGGGSFGIRSIIEDGHGKYWFCNTRYRYAVQTTDSLAVGTSFVCYRHEPGIAFTAPGGTDRLYFMSVIEDDKQHLWMATYNQGVWCYDGSTMKHYPIMKDGKNINIFSIYKDNHGNLWLGTHENGAWKFNGKDFEPFQL